MAALQKKKKKLQSNDTASGGQRWALVIWRPIVQKPCPSIANKTGGNASKTWAACAIHVKARPQSLVDQEGAHVCRELVRRKQASAQKERTSAMGSALASEQPLFFFWDHASRKFLHACLAISCVLCRHLYRTISIEAAVGHAPHFGRQQALTWVTWRA